MDESRKDELRNKIEEELKGLKSSVASLEEQVKPVSPDASLGRLTRLDNMNNQAVARDSLSKAKVRILKLERALKRMDDPDFGYCEECGEEIPLRRLMLLPESTLCVGCAEG